MRPWLLLLIAVAAGAEGPCPARLPADVCAVEVQLYRHTDFHVTSETRDALVAIKRLLIAHHDSNSVLREHLLSLFDHAIEEAHRVRAPRQLFERASGNAWLFSHSIDQQLRRFEKKEGPVVPLDWEPPAGVRSLTFLVEKFYEPSRDRTEYSFGLFGGLTEAGTVEKLRILRYPATVIADKADTGEAHGFASSAAWHETTVGPAKVPFFSLSGSSHDAPLEEGLYLLELKMRGSPLVNGWFVLSHATPTALPVVQVPALNETFATHTPQLRWLDFRSPQFRSFEHRKMRLLLKSVDSADDIAWREAQINPTGRPLLTIGADTPGLVALQGGAYELQLAFEERWLAGSSLFVGRASTVAVPFRVAAGKRRSR